MPIARLAATNPLEIEAPNFVSRDRPRSIGAEILDGQHLPPSFYSVTYPICIPSMNLSTRVDFASRIVRASASGDGLIASRRLALGPYNVEKQGCAANLLALR